MAEAPLTPEQSKMAERSMPLARFLARPFAARIPRLSAEYESESMLALTRADGGYDPERRVAFNSYARYRILGSLVDVTRRTRRFARLPRDVPARDGHDPVARDLVETMLNALPPRYARTIRLVYLDGFSQREAAKIIGCSQTQFRQIHVAAIASLRRSFQESA